MTYYECLLSDELRKDVKVGKAWLETDSNFKKSLAVHCKDRDIFYFAESDLRNFFEHTDDFQKSLRFEGLKKIVKLIFRNGKPFLQHFWIKQDIVPGYSPEIDLTKPRRIKTLHSAFEDLRVVNQNFNKNIIWQQNCQRCVPTYELRRRGFDAVALPCRDLQNDFLANNWWKVWRNPIIYHCRFGSGLEQIKEKMNNFSDGVRIEIYVRWKITNSAHVFIAEKINNEIRFLDPQTSKEYNDSIFSKVALGNTIFLRIDNLEFDLDFIKKCSKWRKIK